MCRPERGSQTRPRGAADWHRRPRQGRPSRCELREHRLRRRKHCVPHLGSPRSAPARLLHQSGSQSARVPPLFWFEFPGEYNSARGGSICRSSSSGRALRLPGSRASSPEFGQEVGITTPRSCPVELSWRCGRDRARSAAHEHGQSPLRTTGATSSVAWLLDLAGRSRQKSSTLAAPSTEQHGRVAKAVEEVGALLRLARGPLVPHRGALGDPPPPLE